MEIYNSELARKVYASLRENPEADFPITVCVEISWKVKNLVYGHHLDVPWFQGDIWYLSVQWTILNQAWEEVQNNIQILLEEKVIAA